MITFDDGTTCRTWSDEHKDSYGDEWKRIFGSSEESVRIEASNQKRSYRLISVKRLCGGIWVGLLKRN